MLVVVGVLALFTAGLLLAGQRIASAGKQFLPQLQQQLSNSGFASVFGDPPQVAGSLQDRAWLSDRTQIGSSSPADSRTAKPASAASRR
jgi:hypothetical protein